MYDPRTMAKTKRKHLGYMQDILQQLEWDLHQPVLSRNRIPYAWRDIAEARYPQPKTRITLWVEKDVLRFYESMGKGYQARMNDTMRAFMLARLGDILKEKDVIEELSGLGETRQAPEDRRLRARGGRAGKGGCMRARAKTETGEG